MCLTHTSKLKQIVLHYLHRFLSFMQIKNSDLCLNHENLHRKGMIRICFLLAPILLRQPFWYSQSAILQTSTVIGLLTASHDLIVPHFPHFAFLAFCDEKWEYACVVQALAIRCSGTSKRGHVQIFRLNFTENKDEDLRVWYCDVIVSPCVSRNVCFAHLWRLWKLLCSQVQTAGLQTSIETVWVRVQMRWTFAQVEDVYEIPEEDFDRLLKVSDIDFANGHWGVGAPKLCKMM